MLTDKDYEQMDINGRLTEIEELYKSSVIPQVLRRRIKAEKQIISDNVKKGLMSYYKAGRIDPKSLFSQVARQISHVFYKQKSGE